MAPEKSSVEVNSIKKQTKFGDFLIKLLYSLTMEIKVKHMEKQPFEPSTAKSKKN